MSAADSWRIGLIGTGRLGSALARALAHAGERVVAVYDQRIEAARRIVQDLPACAVAATPQVVVDTSDLVFLTVQDDAVAAVASSLGWRPAMAAVHCSGAHSLDVLESARRAGAWIGGFHPVQTFPGTDRDDRRFAGCVFGIDAEEPLRGYLTRLARTLGGEPLVVSGADRALYHVAAVFASNAVVTLAAVAARLWQELGLPLDRAARGLVPLMRSTVDNVDRLGPSGALTGPVVRGDVATIQRHVSVLEERFPELLDLYRVLTRATVELALHQGLDPRVAETIVDTVSIRGESEASDATDDGT